MLRVVVFLCGAALMSLELVAARLLAPAMGNSIYVWGSVISTVMVALSLGYWIGGHAADRWGAARALPLVIAAAACATVAAPPIAAATLPWAADLGPRLGSLVASALIFFLPSLLLAMVSPLGVRLAATRGIEHLGRSAGGLYAISTSGSIVGTLATAFWLIPLMSLEPLIVWTGFALGCTALLALRSAAHRATIPVVVALVLVCAIAGGLVLAGQARMPAVNALGETVLLRADTQYHRLTVTQDASVRHLRFDRSHQSAVYLSDPYESAIRYPDYLHLALAGKPDAKRILVLGLGGGTVVRRMWRDYPQARLHAVEVDPVVVDVAKRYFGLRPDRRLRVFTEDARRFVKRTDQTYDIVLVDAYYADGVPFHLTTAEFFRQIKSRLTSDGVVAYNVVSAVQGPRSRLFRSLYRTASGVWDRLWVFPLGIGADHAPDSGRNIVLLATDADVSQAELLRRIAGRVGGRVTIRGFERFGSDLYTGAVRMTDVPELTDAHAPTDSLIYVD